MALSKEDKEEIAAMLKESIGGVATSISDVTKKQIGAALEGLDVAKQIEEALKAKAPAAAPPADAPPADAPPADAAVKAMQAKLEAMARQNEEFQAKAADADKATRTSTMLRHFDDAARAAGVDAARIPALRALLHNAEGRLATADDGASGMVFQRDGYKESLSFDKALPEYLKTDAGKQFLPPTNISGTGDSPQGRSNPLATGGTFNASEAFNRLASLAIQ